MDELLNQIERFKDLTSAFTLTDLALITLLSFALSMVCAWVYRSTYRGASYTQSFAQTLVMMGMITAFIMLIIGTSIARAFSLVGALSVIRFRNAVKETRDVGFMFMVMAIGMACGTRSYLLAMFATAALSATLTLMFKLDLFSKRVAEGILRLRMPADRDPGRTLKPVFDSWLADSRLVAIETVAGGALQELVYAVVLKPTTGPQALLEALRTVTDNNKVTLVVGQQEVDL